MLISFLKKDDDGNEAKSKFMGKGDIIFLLVLAAIIGGIWFYHKNSKEKTYSHYVRCDSLFNGENWNEAMRCYGDDALKLDYRTDSLDSIASHRESIIESKIDSISGHFR